MRINKRLAEKVRESHPEEYDRMRCGLIENELRSKMDQNGFRAYPSENSEIAILRKQVALLLDVLKENGITADLPEFAAWNSAAEEAKNKIKEMLDNESKK